MKDLLKKYKNELENELQNILGYWQENTIDTVHGGFFGRIDNHNKIDIEAPKGAVLNSRILWSFSAGYNLTKNKSWLQTADRAFVYLRDHFIDREFGGVYWTVDFEGNPLDTKKQIYALAFSIYGLSEYFMCTANEEALQLAISLYDKIIEHSYDRKNGGFIEAFSRDWKEIPDLRLSKKDANEKKSMNTHLHLLEAFANLYRAWTNEKLEERITELIFIFLNHIIDPGTRHLNLFFDEEWNRKSNTVSYGHDIEAAWLIEEAATEIKISSLLEKVKNISVEVATAATDGLDNDGGLWYEYDLDEDDLNKQKHWWPQAEAMVGFFNAWHLSGDENFLKRSLNSWRFVQKNLLDKKRGEWFWGVTENGEVMDEDKVGIWKAPYHNSRACIELIKRIKKINS